MPAITAFSKDNEKLGPISKLQSARKQELTAFVMERVLMWRIDRDLHRDRWNEYYRLWRGYWAKEDSQRDSERSRVIMPALANAVEMTVAEMQEATFGNGARWFDLDDDTLDQDNQDAILTRDLLHEDFHLSNIVNGVNSVYLNGALFGTGIAKLVIRDNKDGTINVMVEPVNNNEFVIDSTARTIDEAFGMAHEISKPLHTIYDKIARGIYDDEMVLPANPEMLKLSDTTARKDFEATSPQDVNAALLTEYHGLVPKRLLEDEEVDIAQGFREEPLIDKSTKEELVEAIVTIANESVVLKAEPNPLMLQDRAFVAYQHELVPGRFYGRGVAEKGYNPQKAFDAEHRMRIDAMAFHAAPMFMYNIGAFGGRRFKLNPRPGRQLPVSGQFDLDKQVVRPVDMGRLDPSTFSQTQELERMVHLGTGAMDISGFSKDVSQAESATGASISKSVFVKRAKLVMENVERNFLQPIVKKALMRYIQFDRRYPKQDVKFIINGSLGMVARELEQHHLVTMLQAVTDKPATAGEIIRAFIESSATPNKNRILKAIEQDLQPNPLQQQNAQLQMQNLMLQNDKLQAQVKELIAKVNKLGAETRDTLVETGLKDEKVELESRRVTQEERRIDLDEDRNALEAQRLALDKQRANATGAD